ncbi:hypothetical protein Q7P37_004552 [Cladosporium fusiforme]
MADESAASDQQITFTVKSSSDQKHVVTVSLATTVGDLKQKLSTSDYANIPAERQRLIYSGRVLKDPDTLNTCKIKEGNTVHLVKGADSNQRQNPANQGGSAVPPGAGNSAAGNVPQNIQTGTGAGDPLAQLTGARYAGFHGLPGADMFGADGGMGAPPNPDQMLRMLEDPNFAQQMNEAMNNPAVIDMLRNNPMIRDNPMARAAIENPEMRRMMMNPDMIRMQMQMQRTMGGGGADGAGAFPMPGQTDTTAAGENNNTTSEGGQSGRTDAPPTPFGGAGGANPFAALFPSAGAGFGAGAGAGAGAGSTPGQNTGSEGAQQPPQNPFAGLFGAAPQGGQDQQNNPFQAAAQQMMQNPQMMQQMMQMMGGGAGNAGNAGEAGFNPFGGMGGMGGFGGQQAAPVDNTPPEERYAAQLQQLNDMGFYEFERNVQALRRSGGSVQGAIEYLLSG